MINYYIFDEKINLMGAKPSRAISERESQAEIKKELIKFAQEEFAAKRPLELKVIHLKPQTVFQKGSVFPSLVIKSLQRSHYVIYIDYGEDIRFYFYGMKGNSLGASTLPKSQKILNEMHGKGTTFLKLPKPDPTKGLDLLTMEISTRWKDLAQIWARKLDLSPDSLLPISVVSYSSLMIQFRLGITSDAQKLHFDRMYYDTPLQDIILQRELFAYFCGSKGDDVTLQWLATVWALCTNENNIALKYITQIASTTVESLVIRKGIEWIRMILLNNLLKLPDLMRSLGEKILFASRLFLNHTELRDLKLWILLPLWIMKYGGLGAERLAEPYFDKKVVWELFTFLYQNKELWTNYQLALDPTYNSVEGWLHYLVASFWLKTHKIDEWESQIIPYPGNNTAFSRSEDLIHALQTLKLLDFRNQIPAEVLQHNQEIIKCLFYDLLVNRALMVDAPKDVRSALNTDLNFQITVRNTADWIFSEAEFNFSWTPENRMSLRILNQSNSKFFDIERKMDIKILPLNSGRTKLQLELHFQDPFNVDQRDHLTLWKITAEFEKG